ncbi:MAG: ribosomal RNA small subunit methyltransferase A [Dehalococcoidia bacterium]|nr:ribosomal RNA small subunit methyltransferase A [Dehalococcoidia bacterium]
MNSQAAEADRRPAGDRSSSAARTRNELRRLGVRADKRLGQHFLIDPTVLERIIEAADLKPSDTIVEVGPGIGILTEELVRRAGRVVAVEIDSKLADVLRRNLHAFSNLMVVNANILDVAPEQLIAGDKRGETRYKVVANLPYYIATPILRHFLESSLKPESMVLMVQKEVGQSMSAGPGAMSLLSIAIQLYGKPTVIDYAPRRSFYPEPKVDSAIVRIDVYAKPSVDVPDIEGFFELVKAGFSAPRKQIRNALAIGLSRPPTHIVRLLQDARIDPHRRPETLSLQEWARLYIVYAGILQQ